LPGCAAVTAYAVALTSALGGGSLRRRGAGRGHRPVRRDGLRRLALGRTAGAAGYGSRRGGGFGAESKCECWLGGFRGGCVGP
jgi:hypothetical protein